MGRYRDFIEITETEYRKIINEGIFNIRTIYRGNRYANITRIYNIPNDRQANRSDLLFYLYTSSKNPNITEYYINPKYFNIISNKENKYA